MERTCLDNEHEFKYSKVIQGADVCTHCGILRVPSEIDHYFFEDWNNDDEDDYDDRE